MENKHQEYLLNKEVGLIFFLVKIFYYSVIIVEMASAYRTLNLAINSDRIVGCWLFQDNVNTTNTTEKNNCGPISPLPTSTEIRQTLFLVCSPD